MKSTPLSTFGEFKLINELTKSFPVNHSSTLKSIGDDAAVLKFSKNVVVTTDILLEGIHFDLTYTPLKHLGYKAVSVNISDIAAMNAQPTQILLSLGMDKRFSVEMMHEFMEGVKYACEEYQVDLVGGDTSSSLTGFTVNIVAMGEAEPHKICYRNEAKENDLICVSGDLGAAYLGLQLLEREKALFEKENIQPDLSGHDYILERQLKPKARMDIVRMLDKLKLKPTAMIDVSDGLSSELLHLCNDSKTGCIVYEEKIPIDYATYTAAEEFGINATTTALNGGEDYELLFTCSINDYETLKNIPEIRIIGHITNETQGAILQTRGDEQIPLTAQGWSNFNNTEGND